MIADKNMCLAIPAKIVAIQGDVAKVDFGEGVLREIIVSLVEAKIGEYVLVHAGYAIELIDREQALESLRLWDEILKTAQSTNENMPGV